MEWNTKPPLHWDWDSLYMFNSTANGSLKKLQLTDWDFNGDEGIGSGSIYSSGVGDGGGSGVFLSKGSKSGSIDSSPKIEVKTSKTNWERNQNLDHAKPTGDSPVLEASVGSVEPFLSLMLGKQTYLEDGCAGSNTETSSLSVVPVSSIASTKRSKSSLQNAKVPRCQVEGCNLDLLSAKDYHRKHRVCERHSKFTKVTINGLERRFCQQCSRFHDLSEFDEKKRSCRRRLSDHNKRRRKPQPVSIQLNAARLSTLYDEKQQTSLIWNRGPVDDTKTDSMFKMEAASCYKLIKRKDFILKPENVGDIDGQLHLPAHELRNHIALSHHDSNELLQPKTKCPTTEALNQGIEESRMYYNVDTTQDLHRALSLLSNNYWGSTGDPPKSISFELPMHTDTSQSSMAQTVIPQGLPLASSECWHTSGSRGAISNAGSYSQGFQLFNGAAPYESDYYSNQLN